MSGLMLWPEMQEGNERTRKHIRLGVTAACVIRGVKGTGDNFSYIDPVEDESVPVAEE